MVLAGPGLARASGAGPAAPRRRWALPVAAAAFALALAAYLAVVAAHPQLLSWYDLNVYNHAGLIARSAPGRLYTWALPGGNKFTYTPFAGLVFAAGSWLPWVLLRWLMTVASVIAVPATAWVTLGGLGRRGRDRTVLTLAVAAVGLWAEPVQRALQLGQIEPLLMLLIAWDLSQSDKRWWKGAGVGVAAAVKLVPLIFIPYLVLAGKFRQALAVAGAFVAATAIGFAALPHESVKFWLTGYFVRPNNVGDVASLLNQSLYALVARAMSGVRAAAPVYYVLVVVVAVIGLTAAGLLHRSGRPVAGWITCALTGLLLSPISWDHHWVWIVPVLALLADSAARARGAARWAYLALAAAAASVFGAWPQYWTGPLAFVPHGLLGFFIGPHPELEKYHLHGVQVLSWNLFVLAGVVMVAIAVVVAARTRLARRAPGPAAPANMPAS